MTRNRVSVLILIAAAVAAVAYAFWPAATDRGGSGAALAEVRLPAALDARAESGRQVFDDHCAVCHGSAGSGRDGMGPPLIHRIYEPGHHGDGAFANAVVNGVRAHHWPFGDMAPVAGVSRDDIAAIIAYVRTVQRENGIF